MLRNAVLVKPEARRRKNDSPSTKSGTKELSGIVTDTRMFEFRRPVRVTDYQKDGVWIHECKPLNILAYATIREESWRAFIDYFESDWDSLVQENDVRLTHDARLQKQQYLKLVKSVRSVL